MAPAEFWNDLARQFEQLDPRATVRLTLFRNRVTQELRFLIDADFSTPLIREKFTALAARAGAELDSTSPDPTYAWFYEVARLNPHSDVVDPPVSVVDPYTGRTQYFQSEQILKLSEASAALCYRLESNARQARPWNAVRQKSPRIATQPAENGNTEKEHDAVKQERMAILADFIKRGRAQGIRKKITDEMITQAANPGKWSGRSQIGWWKRNNKGCNVPCDRKIRALLKREPRDIWPDLVRK
jgi:hypothetical protein